MGQNTKNNNIDNKNWRSCEFSKLLDKINDIRDVLELHWCYLRRDRRLLCTAEKEAFQSSKIFLNIATLKDMSWVGRSVGLISGWVGGLASG